jgi:hypothetical protein
MPYSFFESLLFYVFGGYLFFGSFRCQQKSHKNIRIHVHKKQAQVLRARINPGRNHDYRCDACSHVPPPPEQFVYPKGEGFPLRWCRLQRIGKVSDRPRPSVAKDCHEAAAPDLPPEAC